MSLKGKASIRTQNLRKKKGQKDQAQSSKNPKPKKSIVNKSNRVNQLKRVNKMKKQQIKLNYRSTNSHPQELAVVAEGNQLSKNL